MAVTLGYWNGRGLGEPIRYLLKYLEIPYKDVRYNLGQDFTDASDTGKWMESDWMRVKFKLGLDFPNIPYYLENDVKLTQTKTILRYLGRKYGLFGQTEAENTRIDIIENVFEDFSGYDCGLRRVAYASIFDPKRDYEELKAEYISKLDSRLKEISDFLGNNDWMAGTRLTYVDFWVYEILDWNRLFKPNCLNAYKNLSEYMNRFESLPQIKKHITSEEFYRFPIFAPFAQFGGNRLK